MNSSRGEACGEHTGRIDASPTLSRCIDGGQGPLLASENYWRRIRSRVIRVRILLEEGRLEAKDFAVAYRPQVLAAHWARKGRRGARPNTPDAFAVRRQRGPE